MELIPNTNIYISCAVWDASHSDESCEEITFFIC